MRNKKRRTSQESLIQDLVLDNEKTHLALASSTQERLMHHENSISFQFLSGILGLLLLAALTYGEFESRENKVIANRLELTEDKLFECKTTK